MSVKYLYLVAAVGVFGCATTAANTGNTRRANVLTAAEIVDAHADATSAYDAVSRLRPNWLAPHGTTSSSSANEYASVFIDGQLMGDVTALRNVQAYQVGEIRYYNVTEAGAKFGVRAGTTGAIEVTMKGPTQP